MKYALSMISHAERKPLRWRSMSVPIVAIGVILALLSVHAAQAGSLETRLCIVNAHDRDASLTVTNVTASDWNGTSRPNENLDNAILYHGTSLCVREELNSDAKEAKFNVEVRFTDNTTLNFEINQVNAKVTHWRNVETTGTAIDRLFVQQTSGANANGYYIRTKVWPNGNKVWMAELMRKKPDIRVNQITMPASHDAGMSVATKCTGGGAPDWAITQNDSIGGQLVAGTRYFDLRPFLYAKNPDQIYAAHYMFLGGCYGQSFDSILDEVAAFLNGDGKGEAVFLKVSHAQKDTPMSGDVEDQVTDLFKRKLGPLLLKFKAADRPTLAEMPLKLMAGKAVALFDVGDKKFKIAPEDGILPYGDCSDPANSLCGKPENYQWGLEVFDVYSSETHFPVMRDDQLGKMQKHGGYNNNFLFLLSWTLTGDVYVFEPNQFDIRALSARSNPELPTYLAFMKRGLYAVNYSKNPQHGRPAMPQLVYYDFVDPWLNRMIIGMND